MEEYFDIFSTFFLLAFQIGIALKTSCSLLGGEREKSSGKSRIVQNENFPA